MVPLGLKQYVLEFFIKDMTKNIFIFPNDKKSAGTIHGHLERTAYKLSATKIEHSHWSTDHITHL